MGKQKHRVSGQLIQNGSQVTACSGLRARHCVSRAEPCCQPHTVIETERERARNAGASESFWSLLEVPFFGGTKLPGRAKGPSRVKRA